MSVNSFYLHLTFVYILFSDITTPIANNNNTINGIKTTKPDSNRDSGKWKFWRSVSLRRSRKSVKRFGSNTSIQDGGFVHVSVNLPDVVDQSETQKSIVKDPPPKPPRSQNQSLECLDGKDQVKLDSGGQTSKPEVGVRNCEYVNANGIVQNSPPPTVNTAVPPSVLPKYNSLPNASVPSSVNRRLHSPSSGKIKIVSPELTRKSPSKPRKKSGEVTADDRHVLILQSACELLVQKVDPFMIIDKLADHSLLDATALSIYRNPSDNRYIVESIMQTIMDNDYQAFLTFCDILRSIADFTTVVAVLDAMRAVYDVIYEVPINSSESSPILDDERTVSFDTVYYSLDTGKVRSVVELEKLRNTENKRHSRDLLSYKRNSRLSFQSLTSEVSSVFNEDIINNGLPMVTVAVSGHALCLAKAVALSKVIKDHSCILELHIGKTHLRGLDMSHICGALSQNTNISVLDLRLNNIGNEGATHLANALLTNKTMKRLNLSSTGMDADGCKSLAEALRVNTGLSELDLSFLDIGDSGCVALADMFKVNRSLKKVRLRSGSITWIGCGFLLEGIEIGKTVSELDLSRNFIGDAGVDMFLRHLKDDSSLREVNLENCGITATGCSTLSDVILTNKSLRHLDLSVNFIGDQGITKLSNALARNKHIKTLGLNMCGISNDGFSKLLDILEGNATLTLLKLCYNRLGKEHVNPEATSDNLKYRVRIVTSSNPKLKLLLWGNTFDETHSLPRACDLNTDFARN